LNDQLSNNKTNQSSTFPSEPCNNEAITNNETAQHNQPNSLKSTAIAEFYQVTIITSLILHSANSRRDCSIHRYRGGVVMKVISRPYFCLVVLFCIFDSSSLC
jgi:hypothetical protein